MHQGHTFSYNENERRQRQNPEQLLRSIGLTPGMCFVDLGCNDGFFTLPAARLVGAAGKVYAADIDAAALERLRRKLADAGLRNTQIIGQPAEEVMVGEDCADIIFLGTVLHDFADPLQVLKNAKRMVKAGGIIYDLDWRAKPSALGPPLEIRFSRRHVAELAGQAGLTVAANDILDDNYYAVTLRRQQP